MASLSAGNLRPQVRAGAYVAVGLLLLAAGQTTARADVVPPVTMHTDFGPVMHYPLARLIFWGTQWQTGWIDTDTSNPFHMGSAKAQAYLTDFFTNMGSPPAGGNTWHHIFENQYCDNVPLNAVHCRSYTNPQYIAGMSGVLSAEVDPVSIPNMNPTENDVASEVQSYAARKGLGFNIRVLFVVFPPSGYHVGGASCPGGRHQVAYTTMGDAMPYAWIDYPDVAGKPCRNTVNVTTDSLGHGYYDMYSVVASHEWAEMATDPFLGSWYGSDLFDEVGDRCSQATNWINFAWYGGYDHFAASEIWTNEWANGAGGCAYR